VKGLISIEEQAHGFTYTFIAPSLKGRVKVSVEAYPNGLARRSIALAYKRCEPKTILVEEWSMNDYRRIVEAELKLVERAGAFTASSWLEEAKRRLRKACDELSVAYELLADHEEPILAGLVSDVKERLNAALREVEAHG